jgi:hypothetical protein
MGIGVQVVGTMVFCKSPGAPNDANTGGVQPKFW